MTLNYKTFILNIRECMNKIIVNGLFDKKALISIIYLML